MKKDKISEKPVDIQIFGRMLRINCPLEQQKYLNQAAKDLDHRLQVLKDKTRVTNTEQLLFIVALNVCNELAQEKRKSCDYLSNMQQRIRLLQKTIEQTFIE